MASWTKAQLALRNAHISRFYTPYFGHLVPGTPQYNELARSGLVWDKIYKLRDLAPWKAAEHKLSPQLKEIDLIRQDRNLRMRTKFPQLAQDSFPTLGLNYADFASKSCEVEHNHLTDSDASNMQQLLPTIPLDGSPILAALRMKLPSAESLAASLQIPSSRCQDILELWNQLIALQAVLSPKHFGRVETNQSLLEDVKILSQLLLRDTTLDKAGLSSGKYRSAPIQVKSDLYAIFPYPAEVPANMQFWSEWSTKCNDDQLVHPLLKAIWMMLYFVSVHPFQDGNGRLSRTIMAARMARNGFAPVICSPELERAEYIAMIQAAHVGNPEALCKEVVYSELARLL
ncbi:fido domain-containing protein [Boeremia exigua]|uniref:fido domain-containing protein n=1 Tax=Boeremia exigua TaxID=749465 RepID=UPI001E8DB752|nr:fido domain-containing protein [Boeremia exigua]KAH6612463.1 fido domain-containing protein [Boeremia exigua]